MQANACPWCQMSTCRTLVYENSFTMHQIYIPNCLIIQRHIKLRAEYEAYRINKAHNANMGHIEEAHQQWKEVRQNFPNESAKTYQSWKDQLARSQVAAQEGKIISSMMDSLVLIGYRDSDTIQVKRLKNQKVVKPKEGEDSSNAHTSGHDQASHQGAAEVRKQLDGPTRRDQAVKTWLKESAMRLCAATKMEYYGKLNPGRVLVEASPRENNLVVKKKHTPKILQQI